MKNLFQKEMICENSECEERIHDGNIEVKCESCGKYGCEQCMPTLFCEDCCENQEANGNETKMES